MITRRHQSETSVSEALYSDCETYRYALTRIWAPDVAPLMFVMLNPSTATELRNDPTIERCERRARSMGAGGVVIGNLFAFRATLPADLRAARDPIGPENDAVLATLGATSQMCIAAWGVHGTHLNRHRQILQVLPRPLHCLGLTKAGHPRHPLYVPYAAGPMEWTPPDE